MSIPLEDTPPDTLVANGGAPTHPVPPSATHKSFLGNAAVYGLGTLLLQAASVLLLPLYTHYLTPADYGILEILNRTGEVINICLMAGGIRMAALAFYNQAKTVADRQKAVVAATTTVVAFLILGAAPAIAAPGYLGQMLGIENPQLLTLGIATTLLEALVIVPLALMQARVESVRYIAVILSMFLCRVGLAVFFLASLGWGIRGILAASAITSTCFGLALIVRELSRGPLRVDWHVTRQILRFSIPFIPGGLAFFALRNGDRYFLLHLSGEDAVGLFSLGSRLAMTVGAFTVGPLIAVWGARMYAEAERPDAAEHFGRVVTRILAAYVYVGLGLCLFTPEVLRVLADKSYATAGGVVAPLVLAALFLYAANLMDAGFYIRRRTGLKPWIMAASAAVTLGLCAWLVPIFGAHGAAYATLGGFAFHAAATYMMSQRVFHVAYEPVRIFAMVASAIVLVSLGSWLEVGILGTSAKAAMCVAWPAALWFSGLVSTEEKQWAVATISKGIAQCRWFFTNRRTELTEPSPAQEPESPPNA